MKITYIGHSGFLLELEKVAFLFDYYENEIPDIINKQLFVFVSHHHSDHYNHSIFELKQKYPDTVYILSSDCFCDRKAYIHRMKHYQTLTLNDNDQNAIKITTLKSTDAGVAYIVEYLDKVYYHSGDLHLWLWDEDSALEASNMQNAFVAQMQKLCSYDIDVAFIPLDARLNAQYASGLVYCLKTLKIKTVIPMHFFNNYQVSQLFLEEYPCYKDQFVRIDTVNQVIEIGEKNEV